MHRLLKEQGFLDDLPKKRAGQLWNIFFEKHLFWGRHRINSDLHNLPHPPPSNDMDLARKDELKVNFRIKTNHQVR